MTRSFYTDFWAKKTKWLAQALIISSTLNVGLLCSCLYLSIKNSRCSISESLIVTKMDPSKQKGIQELLMSYSNLSFHDLLHKLSSTKSIESGYKERDIALACLTHFHHFNIEQALGGGRIEKEEITFTPSEGEKSLTVNVFPALVNCQYKAIFEYIKTEKWPFTSEGLFLKIQSNRLPYDSSLLEAFYHTKEFHFLHLLFSKTGIILKKEHLVALLTQASWGSLSEVTQHLRNHSSFTLSERRDFLLSLLLNDSKLAAKIFLEIDQDYCLKNFDDEAIMHTCNLLGERANASFLKALLDSSRSDIVRKKSAALLYEQAAEDVPKNLNLVDSRRRFIELKVDKASTAVESKAFFHTVVSGDSLWKIARKHNTTVSHLRQNNSLKTDVLKVGQIIKISVD